VRTRTLTATLVAVAALGAGCGGGPSTPATGSTPAPTAKVNRDVLRGEVVAIKGDVVTVTATTGNDAGTDTSFKVTPTTIANQEQTATVSDVVVGICAFGIGERTAPDLVAAQQVILKDPGPKGPNDCRQGSGGDLHHLGVAGGMVTAVDGDTYTVDSNAGPQRFKVALQTKAIRLVRIPITTLATGQCVSARGPRDSAGTLTASSIVISPNKVGGCFAGGNGPGGSSGG
jgi:hypothetical protein